MLVKTTLVHVWTSADRGPDRRLMATSWYQEGGPKTGDEPRPISQRRHVCRLRRQGGRDRQFAPEAIYIDGAYLLKHPKDRDLCVSDGVDATRRHQCAKVAVLRNRYEGGVRGRG